MNLQLQSELSNILTLFYSIIKIPIIVFLDDWTYYSHLNSNDSDINFLISNKEKYQIDRISKNNFTILSANNKSFYATKLSNIQTLNNYIFILGPIREKKFIDLYTSSELPNNDSISYTFKLLSIIIEDKLKSIRPQNPILDFHVSKAISLIHSNYAEDLTIDSISEKLNLNKCYFCTLFKKETGMTFSKFLNLIRITKSKELLSNESNSILDVAISVGFNNQNYYSIAFKSAEGVTPSAYRKSLLS